MTIKTLEKQTTTKNKKTKKRTKTINKLKQNKIKVIESRKVKGPYQNRQRPYA
jgi:hypothetical protein